MKQPTTTRILEDDAVAARYRAMMQDIVQRWRTSADAALKNYFKSHSSEIAGWFNVIGPKGKSLDQLHANLLSLSKKDWEGVHA